MTAATLTMAQTAAAIGVGVDRLRKSWRRWRRELGFPAPVRGTDPVTRKREVYAWDEADVSAWKQRRKAALGGDSPLPAAANDTHPDDRRGPRPSEARVRRERAEVAAMLAAGAGR